MPQVQAANLPDVFSTTVVLVFYFFVNNMLTGIEVTLSCIYTNAQFGMDIFRFSMAPFAKIATDGQQLK